MKLKTKSAQISFISPLFSLVNLNRHEKYQLNFHLLKLLGEINHFLRQAHTHAQKKRMDQICKPSN